MIDGELLMFWKLGTIILDVSLLIIIGVYARSSALCWYKSVNDSVVAHTLAD